MDKFRYVYIGDFETKTHDYYIEVPIPIEYDSEELAKSCSASLKFLKMNNQIVLAIYSNWMQGVNLQGNWYEGVDGEVLEIIHSSQINKYDIYKLKDEKRGCVFIDADEDFIKCDDSFNDIFDLNNCSHTTISPSAYYVISCTGQ